MKICGLFKANMQNESGENVELYTPRKWYVQFCFHFIVVVVEEIVRAVTIFRLLTSHVRDSRKGSKYAVEVHCVNISNSTVISFGTV